MTDAASLVHAQSGLRLSSGAMSCWGDNSYGQLGTGSNVSSATPVAVSGAVSNAGLIASQGTVLVNRFSASSDAVAGHITPVPWSMVNRRTGAQALMVTYDPLAMAAAEFIEQYDAHVNACNATTDEADIVEDDGGANTNGQYQGKRLWACTKPDTKSSYLSGMSAFLAGARRYLFGREDGCVASTETLAGASCPATLIDSADAHFPDTFFVPDYTSAAYNPEYYGQVATKIDNYRTSVLASSASRLGRTVQLAGVAKFTATGNALITARVSRSGSYGTQCIVGDGFTAQ